MDLIFGDATTAMPTPATEPERDPLAGYGSPLSPTTSFDIHRRRPIGPGSALPGLNIDPPLRGMSRDGGGGDNDISNADSPKQARSARGLGAWLSAAFRRGDRRAGGEGVGGSRQDDRQGGRYRKIDNAEDGDQDF
jgi:hypothetical protein